MIFEPIPFLVTSLGVFVFIAGCTFIACWLVERHATVAVENLALEDKVDYDPPSAECIVCTHLSAGHGMSGCRTRTKVVSTDERGIKRVTWKYCPCDLSTDDVWENAA